MKTSEGFPELINKFHDDYLRFYRSDQCIVCGTTLSKDNIAFFSKVWTDDMSRQISIFNCGSCGLGYSHPFLSKSEEEALYQDYPQHYIFQNILENKTDIFQKTIYLAEKYTNRIFFSSNNILLKKFLSCFLFQRLFQTYPIYFDFSNKNPNILDIGCGDGYFLDKAKKAGWDCYGTEYNDTLIQRLASQGITARKNVEDYIGKKQFDVIRINHVLEHLDDPNKTLGIVYKLLKDNGSLIIGLPNFNTIAKIFKKFYALHLPYHRHHYGRKSLEILLKKHGFKIVYYKTKSTGEFATSTFRKYKIQKFKPFFRICDILASVIFDLFNRGDCIELYAAKAEVKESLT